WHRDRSGDEAAAELVLLSYVDERVRLACLDAAPQLLERDRPGVAAGGGHQLADARGHGRPRNGWAAGRRAQPSSTRIRVRSARASAGRPASGPVQLAARGRYLAAEASSTTAASTSSRTRPKP